MDQLVPKSRKIELGNLELLAKKAVEGFIIGLHKSPFHGFSVEFAEHRLYNQGESTKNIDWKVFARTEKLFTKKYEEETNLRCQFLIDSSSSMFFPNDSDILNKIEFSALATVSIMNLLKKQRDAFGLSIFNEQIEEHLKCRSSSVHYNLIISKLEKTLRDKNENKKSNVVQALHQIADSIHKRSLVVIFSDMLDNVEQEEELFSALQHLKYNKHEVILFHTLDYQKEFNFEYSDRPYEMTDLETGKKITLFPKEIQEQFHKKMSEKLKDLRLKCLRYKIDFVPTDIHSGVQSILQTYLVKRKKMNIV